MHSATTASKNINGLSARTRVEVLHDLDSVFLQEVTDPAISTVAGYMAYLITGAAMRAKAIVARHNDHHPDVTSPPTGRDITATYGRLRPTNV